MAGNEMMHGAPMQAPTAQFAPVTVDAFHRNPTVYAPTGANFTVEGQNRFAIDRTTAQTANFQQPYTYAPQMYATGYAQAPMGYFQGGYPMQGQYIQQMPMAQVPQPPMPQQPLPQRKKNVLLIEDPNTHKPLNLEEVNKNSANNTPNTTVDNDLEAERKAALRKEMTDHLRTQIEQTVKKPEDEKKEKSEEKEKPEEKKKEKSAEPVAEKKAEEPVKEPTPVPVATPVVVKEKTPVPEEPVKVEAKEEEKVVEKPQAEPSLVFVRPDPLPEVVAEVTTSLEKMTVEEKVETEVTAESPDIPSLQVPQADEDSASPSISVDEVTEADEDGATSPVVDAEEEERRKEEEEAQRLKEREAELDALHAQLLADKEQVDIESGFYNRDFLYCVRDIEKEFKRTPCPLTMDQLRGYGLDIHSMPKSMDGKKGGGRTDFNPPWAQRPSMQGRNRGQYTGRSSHDHRGGGRGGDRGGKKPYNARISIDRPTDRQKVTLGNRAENAWKPEKLKPEDLEKEENRIKILLKAVRSLLNKITPTTKDALMKEFLALHVSGAKFDASAEQLSQVVDIMFDKAVEEPKFCALYSEICRKQVDHEIKSNDKKASVFRNALLNRAQTTFVNKTMEDDKKAIDDELDEDKKKQLQIAYEEAFNKFRRRKFGNINFIGELYGQQLLSTRIIQWCLFDLLQHCHPGADGTLPPPPYDEESLQCATQLIEAVGKPFENAQDFQNPKQYLDQVLGHLKNVSVHCSPKIKFKIMGAIELKEAHWRQRKVVDQGPKKLSDIHKEIQQEQVDLQNQRESYERKQSGAGVRIGGNSLSRRNQPPPARNSLDSRFNAPQKRAGAAKASNLAPSTAAPRQMSMSMANPTGPAVKKSWKDGSGGGGTSSEQAASRTGPWNRNNGSREGSVHRKNSTVDEKAAAMAAAQAIGGGAGPARSSSQQSIVSPEEEEKLAEKKQNMSKLVNTIGSDFDEVAAGDLKKDEAVDDLLNRFVGVEKYGEPGVADVFQYFAQCYVEKLSPKPEHKTTAVEILCICLLQADKKAEIIRGFTQFCEWAIDCEYWEDRPKFWDQLAELVVSSVLFEFPRQPDDEKQTVNATSLQDFNPVCVEASKDPRKNPPYNFFVKVLCLMAEKLSKKGGEEGMQALSWEYDDLSCRKTMDQKLLDEALKATRPDVKNSVTLFELLHH